jgi:hypothetical protein
MSTTPASTALVPFDQLNTMARAFAQSGMFGAKNQEQALSLLLLAQAEGVHPAIAMRDFDIINGRPAKKAEAMHRSFIAAGGTITWHKLSDDLADATFSHPQGGTARITWDMARAQKAGIGGKEMYKKYPRQMLKARVVSEGCRTVYPAATSGLYVPEEVRDFAPAKEKNMGEANVVGDEDITNQIPGAGAPDASPAPQQPLDPQPAPSSSSGADAVGAAFISVDQVTLLMDKFAPWEAKALTEFLRIAKRTKLSEIRVDEYDGALEWCERNLKEKLFKKA